MRLKRISRRIWRNKDTKENFCAGKGNAYVSKRQLNQNYSMVINTIYTSDRN